MRRRYNTNYYRKLINKIKSYNQSTCIGVDVIVGFPGEQDLILMILLSSSNLYLFHTYMFFSYSERENTIAKHEWFCTNQNKKKEVKF